MASTFIHTSGMKHWMLIPTSVYMTVAPPADILSAVWPGCGDFDNPKSRKRAWKAHKCLASPSCRVWWWKACWLPACYRLFIVLRPFPGAFLQGFVLFSLLSFFRRSLIEFLRSQNDSASSERLQNVRGNWVWTEKLLFSLSVTEVQMYLH